MNDRTRIVSDEEFAAAVVDRASDLACKGERSPELLRVWASLCGLPELGDPGPAFWEGFVLGGAIMELEVEGFGAMLQGRSSGPVLEILKGGKEAKEQ